MGEVGENLFSFGLRPPDRHRHVITDGLHLLQRLGQAEQRGANVVRKAHGEGGKGCRIAHGGGGAIPLAASAMPARPPAAVISGFNSHELRCGSFVSLPRLIPKGGERG